MNTGQRRSTGEKGIRAGEEALLSSALDGAQELNERCLALLQRLAHGQAGGLPQALSVLGPPFRELDRAAIPTIARQPFLLVDFAFGNPVALHELLTRGPAPLRFPSPRGSLPTAEATALARGTLILAQAICRHHPSHAGLLLGLHPSLQAQIARLRLPDLERLAEEHPHCLRVRWEDRPDIWRTLLSATASTDPAARYAFRMYGMQLMAGEMSQKARGTR